MTSKTVEELTDELMLACLYYDTDLVMKALSSGAQVNRSNRAGQLPVHVLIDPASSHRDEQQAGCLQVMLGYKVNLIAKHRGAYSVYERVTFFLPECARVLIKHHQGVPGVVQKMDQESKEWWSVLAGNWRAAAEAKTLEELTQLVGKTAESRRL